MKDKKVIYKIINGKDENRRLDRRYVFFGLFIFMMVATFSFLYTRNMNTASAVDLSGFKAGNIMSDAVMRNYTSMTEAEIQSFLNKKNSCNKTVSSVSGMKKASGKSFGIPYQYTYTYKDTTYYYHVENNKFVCLNNEKFDGETAAHIIYKAAQDYKINPQVLIVLLQKEQGLITDQWPNINHQYRSATGYGCPDNAPCNSEYYGFKNQVRKAAELFDIVLSGKSSYYPIKKNNQVRYSPKASCGSSTVYIENYATSALYRYTPYQPNAAALRAGYGAGDSCSAYGNRNFYAYFTDWFGSTQKVQYTFAQNYYNQHKSSTGAMTGETVCKTSKGAAADLSKEGDYNCYQDFVKGTLFWDVTIKNSVRTDSNPTFFNTVKATAYKGMTAEQKNDKIYRAWLSDFETIGTYTKLGNFEKDKKYRVLETEKGAVFGNDEIGYYTYKATAFSVYKNNFSLLGLPVRGFQSSSKTKMEWYRFENGYIVGNDSKGWYVSTGKIRSFWASKGYEDGTLGFPKSNPTTKDGIDATYQIYEGGVVFGNDSLGYFVISKTILDKWDKYSKDLGKPVGILSKNTKTKMEWYKFEKGYIVGNNSNGWFVSFGEIRTKWSNQGYEAGKLGFPKSDILFDESKNAYYQKFAGGTVYGTSTTNNTNNNTNTRNTENKEYDMKEKAYEKYKAYTSQLGKLVKGWSNNSKTGIEWYQFENGYIVGNDKKGWYISMGESRKVWASKNYEAGVLGFPVSDLKKNEKTGIEWQVYENGYIVGNDKKGWFESRGIIREKWQKAGFESGKYGFPTSNIVGNCQAYENGKICQ